MKDMKTKQCQMLNQELVISSEIKILGYWLDEQLTGEAHCSRAAGKALRTAGAIGRWSKFLPESDREFLVATLVFPHLTYCQNIMYSPSKTASDYMERAYNRAARMICKMERTGPALEKLGWPTWVESRRNKRMQFVEKIFRTGQPKVLKERFSEPLSGAMATRAIRRGELWEPPSGPGINQKSFGIWAPRVYNEYLRGKCAR